MGFLSPPDPTSTWPSPWRRAFIVIGLTGFAISQPLLSVLGGDPATLAHYGINGAQLVLFACLIAFVPAVGLAAGAAVIGIVSERAGRVVHLALVIGLVTCFVIQVAKSAGIERPLALMAGGLTIGIAFGIAHLRVEAIATWGSYTALLPVLAFGFFVFASPASALLDTASAGPDHTEAEGAARAPVVFIVLDELPTRTLMDDAGGLDRTRFPNLADFADGATWYRHNTTLATFTSAAVPSLLTGTIPTTDPPLWTSHPDSLFTLLAPTHELEVFETVTAVCPYTSCVPTTTADDGTETELDDTGPGFRDLLHVTSDLWLDRIRPEAYAPPALDDFAEAPQLTHQTTAVASNREFGGFGDEDLQTSHARAEQLVDSIDATDPPSLYYLHLMLPHQPWARYPDGEVYRVPDIANYEMRNEDSAWAWSDWTGTVSEQRHTLQAQYSDRLFGQIVDQLNAVGLYDDALIVLMSDHGISFESKTDDRRVTRDTIDALGYSPLFIKAPGQRDGSIDDSNMLTIDVLPTIADILGLSIDWNVDGLPAGSKGIEARGDAKHIYDFSGLAQISLNGVIDYRDQAEFATVSRGGLGDLPDPDDPLSSLHAILGIEDIVGTPLDDLVEGAEGGRAAQIDKLDEVTRPTAAQAHMGMVTGRIPGAPSDSVVVLAIDGVVVGGSRLSTSSDGVDGRFAVLLPQGVLDEANEVRVALLADGKARELRVE